MLVASRTLLRSRCLFSRGCATSRTARSSLFLAKAPHVQRQFASSPGRWQETIETPSQGPEVPLTASSTGPTESHLRSVAVLRLPLEATRSEIEALFKGKGLEIKHMQLGLDRFTFKNGRQCFIELGSEQEAQKAIAELNNAALLGQVLIVKALKHDFVWGSHKETSEELITSRFFDETTTSALEAVKPLLESRRMMLSVQTPGWGNEHSTVGHNRIALDIIKRHMGDYGVEAVGGFQPFHGDKQPLPRFLCLIDFKTTSGADQAVQALHESEIEGRTVWLKNCVLAPWRAYQIGKVDPSVLAVLQEKKIAPMETFLNLKLKRGKGDKKGDKKRDKKVDKKEPMV